MFCVFCGSLVGVLSHQDSLRVASSEEVFQIQCYGGGRRYSKNQSLPILQVGSRAGGSQENGMPILETESSVGRFPALCFHKGG
jgi:hypothetical protein